MQGSPDPVLHVDDALLGNAPGRIDMAFGVDPAAAEGFAPDAFVARPPWRQATWHELARLGVVRGIGCRADTVALLPVPPACLRALRDAAGVPGEAGAKASSRVLETFLAATGRWRLDPSRVRGQGYRTAPAAARGTTRDPTTQHQIGLHLDHWDHLPLDRREQAQNRICVNLGRGSRALQLIPVPACALNDIAIRRGAAVAGADRSAVQRFLGASREQPVLRFLLPPGTAYIAPTERFLHDGCVLGTDEDVTFRRRVKIKYPSLVERGDNVECGKRVALG